MNILILGGTGFISSRVAELLLRKGHLVTLLNRGKSGKKLPIDQNLKLVTGDRNDKKLLYRLTSENKFDVVYDMIAYNESDSQTAVDVFKDKIGRFIHCSTVSVYMLAKDIRIPVTEDQINLPLMTPFYRSPFGWEYGINKIKCEDVLWRSYNEMGFPISILRPTYISGPEDPAGRDYFWIERILDGGPLLVPGDGRFRFQQVFINDVVNIFCKIIETDRSIGEAYNVAGEEIFTLNEYILRLGRLLGKTPELFHLPYEDFDKLELSYSREGDVFTFNTRRDAVFSLAKIKNHLNYSTTTFDDYMKDTISWFLNEHNKHSCGYSQRNKEVEIINKLKLNA